MTFCDYQVLEYTTSELRTHGVQFIVVLQLHARDSYTLTSYVLRDWETKIGVVSKRELSDIENLLNDLRHHSRRQDSDGSFFKTLEVLNVGTIRAFVSGSCSLQDLDTVVQVFFDETGDGARWRDHFDNLNDNEGHLFDLARAEHP